MSIQRFAQIRFVVLGALALAVVGGVVAVALAVPTVRGAIAQLWTGTAQPEAAAVEEKKGVELIRDAAGHPGIRLAAEAADGYGVRPKAATKAQTARALPPQVGTINYDNDRLFNIRTRFPGELAEMKMVVDTPPGVPTRWRPLRFGDKLKQGDILAVVWSQQLGTAKAALVDAICSLRLSKDNLDRQSKLWKEGVMSESVLRQTERQVQADSNAVITAERSLKIWKLSREEIQQIRDEAAIIANQKKVRDSDAEARWAVVEIKVPRIPDDPNAEVTVVEKNTCLNDMLDPINTAAPLFKLADLSRLQVWVHPPEEYLPILRANIARAEQDGRQLEWDIHFQADGVNTPAQKMKIVQIAPSLEPNQHTPMVVGYLNNSQRKYLVGQFVTATIYVPPVPDTVEILPDALNEVGGQALVFVESNAAKHEYTLRRIAVVARFKDAIIVRSRLSAEDEKVNEQTAKASKLEQQQRRPIQALLPGERVLTRGVVELTTALDELLVEERIKGESNR